MEANVGNGKKPRFSQGFLKGERRLRRAGWAKSPVPFLGSSQANIPLAACAKPNVDAFCLQLFESPPNRSRVATQLQALLRNLGDFSGTSGQFFPQMIFALHKRHAWGLPAPCGKFLD
jgi:hypothetical protein